MYCKGKKSFYSGSRNIVILTFTYLHEFSDDWALMDIAKSDSLTSVGEANLRNPRGRTLGSEATLRNPLAATLD